MGRLGRSRAGGAPRPLTAQLTTTRCAPPRLAGEQPDRGARAALAIGRQGSNRRRDRDSPSEQRTRTQLGPADLSVSRAARRSKNAIPRREIWIWGGSAGEICRTHCLGQQRSGCRDALPCMWSARYLRGERPLLAQKRDMWAVRELHTLAAQTARPVRPDVPRG